MSDKFVLSANDQDSILASKVLISKHPDCTHLSAGRRSIDLPEGSDLIFIRPYLSHKVFVGDNGYAKRYNVTILQYAGSGLQDHEDGLTKSGCKCIFIDHNDSFCKFVWHWMYNNSDYPDIILHVHDYMKWELEYPDSKYVHYGLTLLEPARVKEITDRYLAMLADNKALDPVIGDGKAIRDYLDEMEDFYRNELVFTAKLGEHNTLCANLPQANSMFFQTCEPYLNYDLGLIFSMNCNSGDVWHSVYRIDPDIDINDLCAVYGGNAPPNSGVGGFSSKCLETVGNSGTVKQHNYQELYDLEDEANQPVMRYTEAKHTIMWMAALSTVYKGRKALIANSPFLTKHNPFTNVRHYGEEIGVLFCLRSDQTFRIAVINLDGTDPGEEFGERVGNYRLSFSGVIEHLDSNTIKKDVFM